MTDPDGQQDCGSKRGVSGRSRDDNKLMSLGEMLLAKMKIEKPKDEWAGMSQDEYTSCVADWLNVAEKHFERAEACARSQRIWRELVERQDLNTDHSAVLHWQQRTTELGQTLSTKPAEAAVLRARADAASLLQLHRKMRDQSDEALRNAIKQGEEALQGTTVQEIESGIVSTDEEVSRRRWSRLTTTALVGFVASLPFGFGGCVAGCVAGEGDRMATGAWGTFVAALGGALLFGLVAYLMKSGAVAEAERVAQDQRMRASNVTGSAEALRREIAVRTREAQAWGVDLDRHRTGIQSVERKLGLNQ